MNSGIWKKLLPFGILAVAAAGAVVMVSLRPDPPVREPPSRAPFVTVASAVSEDGPIPVLGSGTVRPRAEIDVSAQVGGRVVWVAPAFQSGGRVSTGEVLVRIDDADYRNRLQQARANVAAQGVAVLVAEQEARIAEAEYDSFQRRSATGGGAAASALTLREPQLEAARAALARDSAVLADAELALERTEVRAPFAGIVRSESVDLGQFVIAGQGVGRLYAADAVEIVVSLSDIDAALIPGLWELDAGDGDRSVRAVVSAEYGGGVHRWEGYVDRAQQALDEQTRAIEVVVRVPNARESRARSGSNAPPLLVGQFVDVRIDGSTSEKYFRMPRAALRPGNEVWAVEADNTITIVPVEVLQRGDDVVYAAGVLDDGERVVVGGIEVATNGMEVQTDESAPPAFTPSDQ